MTTLSSQNSGSLNASAPPAHYLPPPSLHGIVYSPGTSIPVTSRFGSTIQLYNHTTKSFVPIVHGMSILELGGIYTTEPVTASPQSPAKSFITREGSGRNFTTENASSGGLSLSFFHTLRSKRWGSVENTRGVGRRLEEVVGNLDSPSHQAVSSNAFPTIGRSGGIFEKNEASNSDNSLSVECTASSPNLSGSTASQQKRRLTARDDLKPAPRGNSGSSATAELDEEMEDDISFDEFLTGTIKGKKKAMSLRDFLNEGPPVTSPTSSVSEFSHGVRTNSPTVSKRGSGPQTTRESQASGPAATNDQTRRSSYGNVPLQHARTEGVGAVASGTGSHSRRASAGSNYSLQSISSLFAGTVIQRGDSGLETKLPNWTTSPGAVSNPKGDIVSSYLKLQTTADVNSMATYWVVLKDNRIKMYKDEQNTDVPQIEIVTENCTALPVEKRGSDPCAFTLIHDGGSYNFVAESPEVMIHWAGCINTASLKMGLLSQLPNDPATTSMTGGGEGEPDNVFQKEYNDLFRSFYVGPYEYNLNREKDLPNESIREQIRSVKRNFTILQNVGTENREDGSRGDPVANARPLERTSSLQEIDSARLDEKDVGPDEKEKYELKTTAEKKNSSSNVLLRQRSTDLHCLMVVRYDLMEDGSVDRTSIAAATIEELVKTTANENFFDVEFVNTFVLTYRHFMTSTELLSCLLSRFNGRAPPEATPEQIEYVNRNRPIIRLHLIRVLKIWIETCRIDFLSEEMQAGLDNFLLLMENVDVLNEEEEGTSLEDGTVPEFWNLAKLLSRFVEHTKRKQIPQEPKPEKVPNKALFLSLDAREIAQQLTMMEYERYRAIRPLEFALNLWGNKEDPIVMEEMTNLNEMINNFNSTSYWVATEICTQPELKYRVRTVERFIKLAKELRRLNNFNTLMAIVSGLNLSAVARLKQTWEAVQGKYQSSLTHMEELVSPQQNYQKYRNLCDQMEKEKYPQHFIPFLGLAMKDLFFINDGNPKRFDNGLINFGKLRTIYQKTDRLLSYRRVPYLFPTTPTSIAARSYCDNPRFLKEAALYKYSCLCEAKAGDGSTIRLVDKWRTEEKK